MVAFTVSGLVTYLSYRDKRTKSDISTNYVTKCITMTLVTKDAGHPSALYFGQCQVMQGKLDMSGSIENM